MNTKESFKRKLEKMTLPGGPDTTKAPEYYDPVYMPILQELGVKRSRDIDTLRYAVDERLVDMGDAIRVQILKDVLAGKLPDITKAPLYREEKEDQVLVHNFPESMEAELGLMLWLNERREFLMDKYDEKR
jgi:hypothetical protein